MAGKRRTSGGSSVLAHTPLAALVLIATAIVCDVSISLLLAARECHLGPQQPTPVASNMSQVFPTTVGTVSETTNMLARADQSHWAHLLRSWSVVGDQTDAHDLDQLHEDEEPLHAGQNASSSLHGWACVNRIVHTPGGFFSATGFEDVVVVSVLRALVLVPLVMVVARRTVRSAWRRSLAMFTDEQRRPSAHTINATDDGAPDSFGLLNSREEGMNGVPRELRIPFEPPWDEEREERLQKVVDEVSYRTNIMLIALFTLTTLCQVQVGIKAVVMPVTPPLSVKVGLTLLLLMCNVYIFALVGIVHNWAHNSRVRYLMLSFHFHPLTYDKAMANKCDRCGKFMSGERMFTCRGCNIDYCLKCFRAEHERIREAGLDKLLKTNGSDSFMVSDHGPKERESEVEGLDGDELSTAYFAKRALGIATGRLWLILLALLFVAIRSAVVLWQPRVQGDIVQEAVYGGRDAFKRHIMLYGLLFGIQAVATSVQGYLFRRLAGVLAFDLRKLLFIRTIENDMVFFDTNNVGDLSTRLSSDVSTVLMPVSSTLSSFLSSATMLFGGLGMMLATSWRLSMITFSVVGPIIVVYRTYARWARRLSMAQYGARGLANQVCVETLTSIRTVRAFAAEAEQVRRYDMAIGESLDNLLKDARFGTISSFLSGVLDSGASVLVLFFGGMGIMKGYLSLSDLVAFNMYVNWLNTSYNSMVANFNSFTRSAGAMYRVTQLLDSAPDIEGDAGRNGRRIVLDEDIVVNDVRFAYQRRSESPVLRGLSLRIPSGSVVALVGRSGCGKTTLLSLLQRLYDVQGGSICIGNEDIRNVELTSYRKQIAVVGQDVQLFNASLRQNVLYGIDEGAMDDAYFQECLEISQITQFLDDLPEGLETSLGPQGVRLSGGQRARVAICRALLRRPRLLCLDESTSQLDSISERLVQHAIDDLLARKPFPCTVIMVAHRLSTLANCSRIFVMDKGVIRESGTHAELLAMPDGLFARLAEHQNLQAGNTFDADTVPGDSIDKLFDEIKP